MNTHLSIIRTIAAACLLALCTFTAGAQEEAKRRPRHFFDATNPTVHDPVMAYEDGRYYLFATGNGIQVLSSPDMKTWQEEKPVLPAPPQWATSIIKGYRGHTWAPDIIRINGLWHLYYSCSAFGKNTSAIGLAVNKTLNPKSPDFKWEDRGMVVRSIPGEHDWNAIDPNIVLDDKGRAWMNWGSFWDGIQMVRLDKDMQTPVSEIKTISRHFKKEDIAHHTPQANDNSVEAPFIIKRGKYYYLFVSFDYCCRGLNSTYKVAVGRSKKVDKGYKDKSGKKMTDGGGTVILQGNDDYAGIGHCSVYQFGDKWYIVAHAYSKKHRGASKLVIKELLFDDEGWVTVKDYEN